ncbi:MAG: hypothetical protein ACYSX0_11560 [Planctomycetota bacterium]|jgi:hypothetical protein
MFRRLLVISVVLLVGAFVAAALAAPPLDGTVFEGKSVPGVGLGDTREEVYLANGDPDRCQHAVTIGDAAFCTWILKDHPGQGGDV